MQFTKSLAVIAGIFILIILAGSNIDKLKLPSKPSLTPGVNINKVQPEQLAQCLTDRGWVMYGTAWCSNCKKQREEFGSTFSYINEIDCDEQTSICRNKNIKGYPVWEGPDGQQYPGGKYLEELENMSGCGESNIVAGGSGPKVAGLWGAFLAGLISFLAPCLLPLLPSYFSAITGFTLKDMYGVNFDRLRGRFVVSSLFYTLGFAIVFSFLGASASIVGQYIQANLPMLLKISGGVLIVFGLMQLGLIKINALRFDYAWNVQKKLSGLGYFTSTFTGIVSALVWIPCVSGILGSILLLASQADSVADGVLLLFVYALGLGAPFIIISFFFPQAASWLQKHRKQLHAVSLLAGVLMVVFGIVLLMDKYREYISWFESLIG